MTNKYAEFAGGNPFASQAKLIHHLDRVHEYLETGDTVPIFMEINPTNSCNLNCYWCINANARGPESIEINALERFFKSFKDLGGKAITFSGGGEPTFYKHFQRAVYSAKEEGLELGLMTDGVYPKRYTEQIGNSFQWIRFSLDTLNKKNYKKWKGVDTVDRVVSNIKGLEDYPAKVGVNCNVGPELSVEEAKNLVDFFVDGSITDYLQFRPILPRSFMKETGKINKGVWNYLDTLRGRDKINLSDDKFNDVLTENYFPFRTCEGHFFEPILDATGDVKVCIYHPGNPNFSFGNIHKKSFKEIWNSKQRQKTIKFVRGFDYASKCQVCCKLTEPNKLIDFLKHPEETPDINFL